MLRSKNYYKILQVDASAEPEIISSAYSRLAEKYHPDANDSPEAILKLQEINEAYEVLSDPIKKADYDLGYSSKESRIAEEEPKQQEQPAIEVNRKNGIRGFNKNTIIYALLGVLLIAIIWIISSNKLQQPTEIASVPIQTTQPTAEITQVLTQPVAIVNSGPATCKAGSDPLPLPEITDEDWSVGPSGAKISILEYGDFQ